MSIRNKQADRILQVLEQQTHPGWVDAIQFTHISLSFTRRIHELRGAGHEIVHEDKWNGRQRRTRYRLVKKTEAA